MQFLRSIIGLIFFIAAISTASLCFAKDRTPKPKGIEVGGFILHPGADIAFALDMVGTNYLFSSDGLFLVGAHFNTKLANDELYAWDNAIKFDWNQYFGLGLYGDVNKGPSVSVSSSADLFKKSTFRLSPSLSYKYASESEDNNLNYVPAFHRIKAGTYATIQQHEGAVFSERLGYHMTGTLYSDKSAINNFEHRINSLTRWNFLQHTHMSLNIDFRYIQYTEKKRAESGEQGRENPSGTPVRIKYSLGGLFTESISFDLGGGYAYIKYDPGTPEHNWLLNARLRFDINPNNSISIEYKKDFENSTYADYYNFHRISLGYNALWFDRLVFDATAAYSRLTYMTDYDTYDIDQRKDHLLTADVKLGYSFFKGLELSLLYRYRQDIANLVDAYGGPTSDYVKHRVTLQLSYEY